MKEYLKKNGKNLGYLDLDKGIYITNRTRKHEFNKFGKGFGLSVGILDYLESKGVSKVLMIYEGRDTLWASTGDFLVHGEDWDDNGDKQIILPGKYFKKSAYIEKQEMIQW